MKNHIKGKFYLFRDIIISRLGLRNDLVGYETLLEYINQNKIYNLEGNFLEIGAFMGGGSKKLAEFANKYNKKLFVIDLFDPDFDSTQNVRGERMNWIYNQILGNRNLRQVFDQNTKDQKNISVFSGDSKKIKLPENTKLCFSFIDGNHNPAYVKNDFYIAWNKTISGGIIAFHDYGAGLPQTTQAINSQIKANKSRITKMDLVPKKCLIFITKK
jgi:hypothetical protein